MSFEAKVIQIMIASPSDVSEERTIIRDIIYEWNAINTVYKKVVLLPIGWETHSTPEMGDRGQAILNKQILKDSDILVAVFWTRIGTPTGDQKSGTVEEIMEHYNNDKPTMIYFSNKPVELDSVDRDQYQELQTFKDWCKNEGLIHEYSSIEDFSKSFYRHLSQTIISYLNNNDNSVNTSKNDTTWYPVKTEPGQIPDDLKERKKGEGDTKPNPALTSEAIELLLAASEDPNGTIFIMKTSGGSRIITNRQDFVGDNTPRTRAKWEAAVEELLYRGYIKEEGYKGEVFSVTSQGYSIADWLKSNE